MGPREAEGFYSRLGALEQHRAVTTVQIENIKEVQSDHNDRIESLETSDTEQKMTMMKYGLILSGCGILIQIIASSLIQLWINGK